MMVMIVVECCDSRMMLLTQVMMVWIDLCHGGNNRGMIVTDRVVSVSSVVMTCCWNDHVTVVAVHSIDVTVVA